MNKHLITIGLIAFSSVAAAQSGTNSPYSQFGLGKLADQSVGPSRGMNGTGLAFREGNQVNSLNPASYSSIDSLTFIFDIGMSLQNTNFKEVDGNSKNVKNADFEYAVASFRAMRHLGIALGIIPFSNIGYSYMCPAQSVGDFHMKPSTDAGTMFSTAYNGSGGLHEVFLGAGWQPVAGLSVGINAGYMWGSINNYSTMTFTDAYTHSYAKQFTAHVRSYKLDFGAQYSFKATGTDEATVGAVFSPGHKFGTDGRCLVISGDSTLAVARNAYCLPAQVGIGFAWKHMQRWKVGADYTFQHWSNIQSVDYMTITGKSMGKTDSYNDRHSLTIGGEYCKDAYSRDIIDCLRYRLGVGYSSSFLKINDAKGPRELSVSAGIGIPIMNGYNNRSVLNVGLRWQNFKASNMLTENTLLLNIGITFNERWFAKWKFE